MKQRACASLVASFASCLCTAQLVAQGSADVVVTRAKLLTVDPEFTIAEALAIADERIVAVG
ncbi:MAG: amidohydrolase, partial [Gammaproteobacteria bacterium]|nr:amidohydrolase [Gammaproteobacteria bacterium]